MTNRPEAGFFVFGIYAALGAMTVIEVIAKPPVAT